MTSASEIILEGFKKTGRGLSGAAAIVSNDASVAALGVAATESAAKILEKAFTILEKIEEKRQEIENENLNELKKINQNLEDQREEFIKERNEIQAEKLDTVERLNEESLSANQQKEDSIEREETKKGGGFLSKIFGGLGSIFGSGIFGTIFSLFLSIVGASLLYYSLDEEDKEKLKRIGTKVSTVLTPMFFELLGTVLDNMVSAFNPWAERKKDEYGNPTSWQEKKDDLTQVASSVSLAKALELISEARDEGELKKILDDIKNDPRYTDKQREEFKKLWKEEEFKKSPLKSIKNKAKKLLKYAKAGSLGALAASLEIPKYKDMFEAGDYEGIMRESVEVAAGAAGAAIGGKIGAALLGPWGAIGGAFAGGYLSSEGARFLIGERQYKTYLQDEAYRRAVAHLESGGDPNAKNPNPESTSQGLYGFLEGEAERFTEKYKLQEKYPFLNFKNINDPAVSAILMDTMTNENREILKNKGILDPTQSELYMMHHFGAGVGGEIVESLRVVNENDPFSPPPGISLYETIKKSHPQGEAGAEKIYRLNPHLKNFETTQDLNEYYGRKMIDFQIQKKLIPVIEEAPIPSYLTTPPHPYPLGFGTRNINYGSSKKTPTPEKNNQLDSQKLAELSNSANNNTNVIHTNNNIFNGTGGSAQTAGGRQDAYAGSPHTGNMTLGSFKRFHE